MTLKSALEDLTQSTLKAVAGLWAKLEYVARLRRDQRYEHWGLARVHGEDQANQALMETHHTLLSRLLRTPIRRLAEDISTSSGHNGLDSTSYVENLQNQEKSLLPANPSAGSERHLSSVLKAVSSLVRNRKEPSPPTS
jgi:hypothetical protein